MNTPSMPAMPSMRLVDLAAEDTHVLRRRLLRDGTLSDEVIFDGDELETTFHLGARLGDRLVAISSWYRRPCPHDDGAIAYQLRGMATDPAARGTGIGGRLLEHGVGRCRRRAAAIVWARARVSALDFYRGHGFRTVGPEYVDTTTGLPHADIVRTVR